MPPVTGVPAVCDEVASVTVRPSGANGTSVDGAVDQDDLSALLYIVVTLLFYSMGIIVGIITYLKRERADMEEEMMFEKYLAMKRDPFNVYRKERVRQMADYLHMLEKAEAIRRKQERLAAISAQDVSEGEASEVDASHHSSSGDNKKTIRHLKISDCVPGRASSTRSLRRGSSGTSTEELEGGGVFLPLVLSTTNMIVGSTTGAHARVFHVPSSIEYVSAAPICKPFEFDRRRAALPLGSKALWVGARPPGDSDTAVLVQGPVVNQPISESHQ